MPKIVETEISPPHQVLSAICLAVSGRGQAACLGRRQLAKVMSFEVVTSRGVLSFAVLTDYLQDGWHGNHSGGDAIGFGWNAQGLVGMYRQTRRRRRLGYLLMSKTTN